MRSKLPASIVRSSAQYLDNARTQQCAHLRGRRAHSAELAVLLQGLYPYEGPIKRPTFEQTGFRLFLINEEECDQPRLPDQPKLFAEQTLP